ncbi:hypothetical protein TL16_g09835 [Triparma laevis f. inornata]|uniref:Uncharacterized protein n=1 Tax=Triparma laevis f. inornata TaxID=1714386 RepID=A0A9W7B5D2_9STRA|nr:hypothetical protein TL16_g09835 [Triparma laevis f. inornata]
MSEASTKSLTKSLHNSLTRTKRIAQPPKAHVTECLNVFYVFNVIISMVYPALYMLEACLQHLVGYESDVRPQWGLYSENGIANLHNLYIVTTMPIAIVAMALSCAAKPRRNDLPFMITLNLQYFVFALGSEVFFVIRESGSPAAVKLTVIRSFFWLLVRSLGLRLRSAIANLPDPELSHFLTYSVFVGGITGLLQLAFLMFSSIQCDISMTNYENQSWRECKRTTYSQTGVGVMVAFFILLKIIGGVIPKKVLAKHFVSIRQIISMNLNFLEFLQCLCISISSFCLLFLLANYGAEGDFKNENEASFFYNTTIVGVSF